MTIQNSTFKALTDRVSQDFHNENTWAVLADYLEERGDNRSELIRVCQKMDEIASSQDPLDPFNTLKQIDDNLPYIDERYGSEYSALRDRKLQLETQHGSPRIYSFSTYNDVSPMWCRGFAVSLHLRQRIFEKDRLDKLLEHPDFYLLRRLIVEEDASHLINPYLGTSEERQDIRIVLCKYMRSAENIAHYPNRPVITRTCFKATYNLVGDQEYNTDQLRETAGLLSYYVRNQMQLVYRDYSSGIEIDDLSMRMNQLVKLIDQHQQYLKQNQ